MENNTLTEVALCNETHGAMPQTGEGPPSPLPCFPVQICISLEKRIFIDAAHYDNLYSKRLELRSQALNSLGSGLEFMDLDTPNQGSWGHLTYA